VLTTNVSPSHRPTEYPCHPWFGIRRRITVNRSCSSVGPDRPPFVSSLEQSERPAGKLNELHGTAIEKHARKTHRVALHDGIIAECGHNADRTFLRSSGGYRLTKPLLPFSCSGRNGFAHAFVSGRMPDDKDSGKVSRIKLGGRLSHMEHRLRPSGTSPDRLRGDASGSDCGGAAKEFCWKRIVLLFNKAARHNYSLPGIRVSGSFASTAHVWGSCQLSVDRYSATSSAGNDSAIALTAAWILSGS